MSKPQNRTSRESIPAGSRAGPLGSDQLAEYHRTGWLLARGFVTALELESISRWMGELLALPEEPGKHMVYYEPNLAGGGKRVVQRIENFCPFHAAFDAFVRGGKLRGAVDQLIGQPGCLFKEKINFKMPGGAGFEPHQDQQAGWSRYARKFLTALVTIDRATVENGCLEIPDIGRFTGLIGEEWRPLSAAEMGGFSLVPVPTEPGDVLFFDSYLPHASKPNLTDRPRRILYLTYNAAQDGDQRACYFADKRSSFPPDVERLPGVEYKFRV
jgi:2-aminoethylphosphonate dioxygenase